MVDAICDLANRINIHVTVDGWSIQAQDDSCTSLFSFNVSKDSFLNLRVEQPMTLGINLRALKSVINIMKFRHVHLKSVYSGGVLTITGKDGNKTMVYELRLLDIPELETSIPEMDFDYIVHLPSSEFVRTCQTNLGKTMIIQIGSNIMFTSKGIDGTSHVQYDNVVMKSSGEITMEVVSRFLKLFTKGALLSKMVVLYVSPGKPILIEFSFDGGHMQYWLAPLNY